jgi:hypothetical protein
LYYGTYQKLSVVFKIERGLSKHDKNSFDIDRLRLFLRENKIEVSIEIEEEVIQQLYMQFQVRSIHVPSADHIGS